MKNIITRGRPAQALNDLLQQFQEAVLEGYRLPEGTYPHIQGAMGAFATLSVNISKDKGEVKPMPAKPRDPDAAKVEEPVEVAATTDDNTPPAEDAVNETPLSEMIKAADNYKDLKALAEANENLEMPKAKNPKAVKKDLLRQLGEGE